MAEEKPKNTASTIAKGDAKGLLINLLLNEIPGIGPIIASKTWRAYRRLKGDLTSPTGILTMILIAPTCDLISFFIPFVGPIISTAVYWPIDKMIGSGQSKTTTEKKESPKKDEKPLYNQAA